MGPPLSLCVAFVVSAVMGSARGAGVLQDDHLHVSVGGNVTFTTTNPPQTALVIWDFQGETGAPEPIITSTTVNLTSPKYEGRISLVYPLGSLELRNLSLEDNGVYRVSMIPPGEISRPGDCTLEVLVPVSRVLLTPSSSDLLEHSSVTLSCSSAGSSLSFRWTNGSNAIAAGDGVQITHGGSNLTLTNVSRHDGGPFRCHVSNPVSNGSSNAVNLSISYGPENTDLGVSPSQKYHEKGTDVLLSCSTVSRPAASFRWLVNETLLADQAGAELVLTNLQTNQSGNYSCQAHNNKTLRNETSPPVPIFALERLSRAFISPSSNMTMEGTSVNLSCGADGDVFSRRWKKDGWPLPPPLPNGGVLSFPSLQRGHAGLYTCNVSNPISWEEAGYIMRVYYGPEGVKVKGPHSVVLNQPFRLSCSAVSNPAARYTWTLNATEISQSAILSREAAKASDSGSYVCEAHNSITNATVKSATHTLSVGAEKAHTVLSAGGIAAIVIACLAALAGVLAFCLHRNRQKRQRKFSANASNATAGGQNNTAYTDNGELHYATITNLRSSDGETRQPASQDSLSEYSEVKINRRASQPAATSSNDIHLQSVDKPDPQEPPDQL